MIEIIKTTRYNRAVADFGFDSLVMFVTGMSNIRDVITFPRTPQNAEF